jgi:tripartite-type tricarboxylate transporter receptor subunit TctC
MTLNLGLLTRKQSSYPIIFANSPLCVLKEAIMQTKASMNMRRRLIGCSVALVLSASAGLAVAQSDGPPARILVGFAPGGSADVIARLMAEKLQVVLKRTVLVENRPGAGGRIVVDFLKNAPADGSVVMLAPETISTTAPIVFKKLSYDPTKDFTPISLVVQFPFAFAVGTDPKSATFQEYVAWAKANPARANFGSPAPGSPPHFFGLLIGKNIGVDMVHVPFQGTAPIVTNLAGGQVSAGISSAGDFVEHHRGGRVRVLAVSSDKRMPQLPDVPTFIELGYPSATGTGFYALYAPSKTPSTSVEQWNQAVRQVVAMPDVQEKLRNLGLEPVVSSPGEVTRLTAAGAAKWEPIIRASGFSLD